MAKAKANGRVILITGGAGVLGRVMAQGMVARGHRVMLTDIDQSGLEACQAEISSDCEELAIFAADLTLAAGPKEVVAACERRFGQIDILVNNAALTAFAAWPADHERPLPWQVDLSLVEKFFTINLVAQHALSALVIPGMIDRAWGRIINVSCSYDTMQRIYPYGTTKAALEAFTGSLEQHLTGSGVSANSINPGGPVATEAHIRQNPGRKWVNAEVMIGPLAYLASEASNGSGGKRYLGTRWRNELPPSKAAEAAGGPLAWSGFGETALR